MVSWDRALIGRAGYYIRLAISPSNDSEVLVANSSFLHSTDGGETFRTEPWGGDNHDIWIDPQNADRFAITHDGGMSITQQHGRSIQRVTLPIGQMYHVAVDNQIPYYVYTNMQDDTTMRGVSTGPEGSGLRAALPLWEHGIGGCESGFTVPDWSDPNIVWATCYANEVTRYDAKMKRARSVSPWMHTLDSPPNDAKYRCHWSPPLAVDPFEHNTVYYGCQVIFRTTNGGVSWSVISPDLSTGDPKHVVPSGGIVGDNLGQFYGEVVFAIAPSELQKGLIWAGTNDGQVWYSKDAGGNWTNVSKNIAGLPAMATITKIEPSHFDAGTAYVVADLHLEDDRTPYIFKTTDWGKSWTKISDGLPRHSLGYARSFAEDPNQKGVLFAGTGNGFFYSIDDGGHWTAVDAGLPHAPVTWIAVQKNFRDVVVSTYGRGVYILDDVTALEQMAQGKSELFAPRAAYRFARSGRAFVNFSLKAAARGPVMAEVLDAQGKVIRTLRSQGRAGLNRLSWDLRYEAPRLVALRTAAPENPNIWDEPRFRGQDSRKVTHWGLQQAEVGPMAAPGKYTVRLTVEGQTYTQPLEILRDPTSPATDADLTAQVRVLLKIRDDISASSDMVNRMEWMRKQIETVKKSLSGDVLKAYEEMDRKILDVETKILERAQMNSDDKYFVEAYKVYMNLIWLNGVVGTGAGDVAGGADWGPTETSLAILNTIEKDLEVAKAEYGKLLSTEVPAFNKMVAEKGVTPLAVGTK